MKRFFTNDPKASVSSDRILYTAPAFPRDSMLYLQEIGTLQALKSHVSRRADLSSYLCFFVLEGKGVLHYNGKEYELNAGDCVFIDCRLPYSHTTDPEMLWKLSWVHFNGHMMSAVYDRYEENGGTPVLHGLSGSVFQEIYQDLYELAGTGGFGADMRINSRLSELLAYLLEMPEQEERQSAGKQKRDLTEVRSYLDLHYAEKISLDELADHFFINKFYLTKLFKEQFGLSINRYLQNVRITHAKKLLRFSDEKIETIGEECGLGNLAYFSRTFKKTENVGPREYRSSWRDKTVGTAKDKKPI